MTAQLRDGFRLSGIALVVVALATGCGTGPRGVVEDAGTLGAFGDPCRVTEDCASGLCLAVSATARICTRACAFDGACPGASNWGCITPEGLGASICGCVSTSDAEVCGNAVDDDCDGASDDCLVCDGTEIPPGDPRHCGACTNVCRSDEVCDADRCACPSGEVECSGRCVSVFTDEANCGACGTICPSAQVCGRGACACPTSGTTYCAATGACLDLDTNATNCGACGSACDTGGVCVGGACECTSTIAPDYCAGAGCVDLASSPSSCGVCGNTCTGATSSCRDGACSCPLPGASDCGGSVGCVTLASDLANCGTCGHACDPGARCVGGTCTCDSGLTCGGLCAPVGDVSNCRACGSVCDVDQFCGAAGCTCYSGTRCGDACVDLAGDTTNCGSCGNTCRVGELCRAGGCQCVSGQTWCASAGTCIPTTADPANCGGCGITCDDAQVCAGSTCACPIGGQTYCAGTDTCSALSTSVQNCGACGVSCRPGEFCASGVCRCATGQTWCAGADTCVSLSIDASNCGGCGNVCPAETACVSYSCRCTAAGLTLCGSACVDPQADTANCGSCGRVCGAAEACVTGVCTCPLATLGTEQRLTSTTWKTLVVSDVAAGAGEFAVVITDEEAVYQLRPYFVRMSMTGEVLSTTALTSTLFSYLYGAAAVWTGTEWRVLVHGNATGFMVRVDTTGAVLGTTTFAAPGPYSTYTRNADLFYYDNNFVAVLYGRVGTTSLSAPNIYFIRSTGEVRPAVPVAAPAGGSYGAFDAALSQITGEIAVLAQSPGGAVSFIRLNYLGASVLPVLTVFPWTAYDYKLVHTGTTWMAVWENSVGGRAIGVALGADLGARGTISPTRAVDIRGITLAKDPTGPDALVTWSEAVAGTTNFSLRARRIRGTGVVGPVEVWVPAALDFMNAPTAPFISGGSGLFAWIDTRWGPTEAYAAPFTFPAGCPP